MATYEVTFPNNAPVPVGELQLTSKGWETVVVMKPCFIHYTTEPYTFQDHYDRIIRSMERGDEIEMPEWLLRKLERDEGHHIDWAETINHVAISCGVNRDLVKLLG